MKIHIKNGRIIDPKNNLDTVQDLFVAAGRIAGIGKAPNGFTANQTINATGLIVAPGFVDLSARLREPGDEYKATLNSELMAAVAGGITSLSCPPDTDPILDEPGLIEMLKYRAKQLKLTHVYPLAALTQKLEGKAITEMYELTEAGCVGFTQANFPILNTQVLWRAFEYASTFGYTLFLRPEEHFLSINGVAHDGEIATRLGLKGIPSAAETLAIDTILRIASETKTKVHLCRLSTAEGVELVRTAKKKGIQITADVSAQHLHFTEHDISYFNTHSHLKPPLRSLRDKDALCNGVKDGSIDAICSDHTPVDDDAKLLPFATSEAGASALELLLPSSLKWAEVNNASLSDAIAKITIEPAKILGIHAGDLSMNSQADITIIDPQQAWEVAPNNLKSQGNNTPFLGLEMQGKVRHTLIEGQITYQSDEY